MTLILSNDDVEEALNVKDCLTVMEESYREQAASRAVNRPTCHSYLPHALPNSTYSFKSVDGGIGKYEVLALRITSDVVQEQEVHGTVRWKKSRWRARECSSAWCNSTARSPASY